MNTAPVSAGVTDEAALSRPSWALLASTMVAALGGCLFGFDTAVISGANDALEAAFGLGSIGLGFTVASALIGTVVGSATAAMPADSLGRRKALIGLAVLYFASALGCALAQDWYTLVVARTLGGLAVGGTSVVSPLYIAEISPARWRGRLVAVVQFNIVLGILLAYLSNYLIGRVDHGASAWRWMLGVQAVPSALFFGLLFFLPESPRWLVASGRDSEARSVQQMLGFDAGEIDRQVGEIRAALDLEHHNLSEPLFSQAYVKPLGLAVTIALFNQLSGINAVMYYAPSIFRMSGAGDSSARLQAVAVGVMNLVFTMIAMTAIDRLGRRKLMIAGSIGYILSLSATAWAFYRYGQDFSPTGNLVVMAGLLVFIASHALGQGAVIWVFISEIFPNRVRARGQAVGCTVHWVAAAIISWTFPVIAERSGGHAFAFYAAMMVLQLLWALFIMPETRGVPLEEIQRRLGVK